MKVAAIDLGSSSARVIAGTFDGARLALTETVRVENVPVVAGARVTWDLDGLVSRLRPAVGALVAEGLAGVAVDSWGVDHVLTGADGRPVLPVAAYRDQRTLPVAADLERRGIDVGVLWPATGILPQAINTSHQLAASLAALDPDAAESIARVQLVPDYVAACLGAEPGWSRGICSTTGLTVPGAQDWAWDVIDALGLPPRWFGPISPERTIAGRLDDAPGVAVIRGGSHDTACAVHALPGSAESRAFLSCGSWSLLGVELDTPLLDDAARAAGFTNEVRTDGGIRLLRNLPGMWVLQECVRQWAREGHRTSWAELSQAAAAEAPARVRIDLGAADLQAPGDMPSRVRAAVLAAGGQQPDSPAQVARLVLDSLAGTYAAELEALERITGVTPTHLTMVGGGTRNSLLTQLTADACGIPVVVGPAEATSIGSILAQLETLGEIADGERTRVVEDSFPVRTIEPRPDRAHRAA